MAAPDNQKQLTFEIRLVSEKGFGITTKIYIPEDNRDFIISWSFHNDMKMLQGAKKFGIQHLLFGYPPTSHGLFNNCSDAIIRFS